MIKFRRIGQNEIDILETLTLRKADANELKAATGLNNPLAALKSCVLHSTEWTEIGYDDETGVVHCLFGLSSAGGIGIPWMVASPLLRQHKKLFIRYSKKVITEMFSQFDILCNYVDSRNTLHIHWLKHMGFVFEGEDIKLSGVPFKYFYLRKEN